MGSQAHRRRTAAGTQVRAAFAGAGIAALLLVLLLRESSALPDAVSLAPRLTPSLPAPGRLAALEDLPVARGPSLEGPRLHRQRVLGRRAPWTAAATDAFLARRVEAAGRILQAELIRGANEPLARLLADVAWVSLGHGDPEEAGLRLRWDAHLEAALRHPRRRIDWIVERCEGYVPPEPLPPDFDERLHELILEDCPLDRALEQVLSPRRLSARAADGVSALDLAGLPITLCVSDVSLRTVLDLFTEPNELAWRYQQGEVRIYGRESSTLRIRYHDLKDLGWWSAFPSIELSQDPFPLHDLTGVDAFLRRWFGPVEAWQEPASLDLRNGILIVRHLYSPQGLLDAVSDQLRLLQEEAPPLEPMASRR